MGAGTYDVYFTDGIGCQSATLQTSLANPGAPVLDIINDTTSCGVDYTLGAIGGSSLNAPTYYDAPGGSGGGGNVVSVGTVYSTPTSITLYAYDESGVCFDEEPFTIVINEIPTMNTPSDVVVCPGEDVVVDAFTSTPAGGSFGWTNGDIQVGIP